MFFYSLVLALAFYLLYTLTASIAPGLALFANDLKGKPIRVAHLNRTTQTADLVYSTNPLSTAVNRLNAAGARGIQTVQRNMPERDDRLRSDARFVSLALGSRVYLFIFSTFPSAYNRQLWLVA